MDVNVAGKRFDRIPDGRLLANDEGDWSEIREATAISHPKAEILGT
jgi:hypothetical protein